MTSKQFDGNKVIDLGLLIQSVLCFLGEEMAATQYSRLENPIGQGTWRVSVRRFAKWDTTERLSKRQLSLIISGIIHDFHNFDLECIFNIEVICYLFISVSYN